MFNSHPPKTLYEQFLRYISYGYTLKEISSILYEPIETLQTWEEEYRAFQEVMKEDHDILRELAQK